MRDNVHLILGTAHQSSWSMRAFLCASPLIEDVTIDWRTFDQNDRLSDPAGCPTAKVPVLCINKRSISIVESLAIAEILAELGGLQWPKDWIARAKARSLCLEFQSNSEALRKAVPMDLSVDAQRLAPHHDLIAWVERLEKLMQRSDGEFLYGQLSIADAWFSPVIARAIRCDMHLSPVLQAYFESLKATHGWKAWMGYVDRPNADYLS